MPSNILGQLQNFRRDRSGSPALEFALIAPLFFAGVFGTFELGRALYERSQFGAAASLATREITIDPSITADQIKTLIRDKLGYDADEITILVSDTNETIAGQQFKKIAISYRFEFLVGLGSGFDGVTLETTRYAPIDPNA